MQQKSDGYGKEPAAEAASPLKSNHIVSQIAKKINMEVYK